MQERYRELPEEITELFEYGTVTQVIDRIVKEFGLREESKELLQMEIEMVLFFFLTREGLAARLIDSLEINETRAAEIAKQLDDDLFVIVDDLLTYAEQQFAGTDMPTPTLITDAPLEPKPASETSTTVPVIPESPQQLKPLRTFAMDVDMSRIHGYGAFKSDDPEGDTDAAPTYSSSQDDIIKK